MISFWKITIKYFQHIFIIFFSYVYIFPNIWMSVQTENLLFFGIVFSLCNSPSI